MSVRAHTLAARPGDEEKFTELMTKSEGPLVGMLHKHFWFRGESFIDSVKVAAMTRAWLVFPSYNPELASFLTWLWYQVKHVVNEEMKLLCPESVTSMDGLGLKGWEASTTGPAEEFARAERRRLVWQAVRSLPREYRFPLILCVCGGYTIEEAAARLRVSFAAVRCRLEQAKARLRKRLRGLDLGPDEDWFAAWVWDDQEQAGEEPRRYGSATMMPDCGFYKPPKDQPKEGEVQFSTAIPGFTGV